ncbi:MAG: RagB/SusD family nutrient uptake outer membrane protein [Ginsengibacter sp.]
MKFFIKTALVIFTAIILTGIMSCKKDWLKPQPLSFYEADLTYVDAPAMQAALVAAARNLRLEYYGDNPPILTEMLFSEVSVEGTTDKSGPAQDLNVQITPDNVQANDADHNKIFFYWNEGYAGIKYANTVISRIDNATYASRAERNAILGAAYFQRAMRYYRLTNQFGDVPAVFKEITAPKLDFYSTKREVILARLKQDLDSAQLWVSDGGNKGDVTKGAILHLLTKINLALGKFDDAIASASSIINGSAYSLMTAPFGSASPPVTFLPGTIVPLSLPHNVIWDLHRPENKSLGANKEGLYMIIDRFGDGGFYTFSTATPPVATGGMRIMRQAVPLWGTNINTPTGKKGTNDNVTASLSFKQSDFVGRGIGRCRATPYSYQDIWTDTFDLRHSRKAGNWTNMEDLLYNEQALKTTNDPSYLKNLQLYKSGTTGILCTDTIRSWYPWPNYKLFIPDAENSPQQGGHTDWYIFRIAETYLLRAEAYFWKGDLASAAADINKVRTRAGATPLLAAQVNIGTILDERARELYYEEPRKTELTRIAYLLAMTGKPADNGKTYSLANFSDNNYFYDRIIAKNIFYRTGVKTNHGDQYTISPYHVLWPVPTSSIQANTYGRINQNKGYTGYGLNAPPLDKIPE